MKWLSLLTVLALVATSDENGATGPVCARAVQASASTGLHGGHQVQTSDLEELGWDVAASSADRATLAARDLAIERGVSSECRARAAAAAAVWARHLDLRRLGLCFQKTHHFACCPLLQTPRGPCS